MVDDKEEENKCKIPILKVEDYMQQQMVNFENHQCDGQNEWVNLYVNIQLNAKTNKERIVLRSISFGHTKTCPPSSVFPIYIIVNGERRVDC